MNLVHEGVLPPNEPDDRDERREEWEMAQKRETVADIVAELRNKTGNMYDCTITTDEEEFHSYADRIETAWEREREELDKRISDLKAYAKLWTGRADELRLKCDEFYAKAKHVGNAAAMQEALREAIGETCAGCKRDCDDCMNLKSGWMKKAKAALSVPARNCDLYATATEALKAQDVAFNESNFKDGECKLGCPGCADELIDCRILWLFAPAEERKGESYGK